jgi:hypothetical protein
VYRHYRTPYRELVKFNHVGIPTTEAFEGEIALPHLKMTVSDHLNNPFGNGSGTGTARPIPSCLTCDDPGRR